MATTYEGFVEHGQIRLRGAVTLPDKTTVYVIVPDTGAPGPAHVYSPRLANPQQAVQFKKQVLEAPRMETYDAANYDPPAPVAVVTLRDPAAGTTAADVVLLVDTGADVTLLPRPALERLGIAIDSTQRMELAGFDGSRSFAPIVTLDVMLFGRAYRGQYLVTDAERGILGRDVLNHLALLIDGPQLNWSPVGP